MNEWDIIAIAFAFVVPAEVLVGLAAAFVKCKKCPYGKEEGYRFAVKLLAAVFGIVVITDFYWLTMLFS